MNKNDLVKIATQNNESPREMVTAIFRAINTALLIGDKVQILRFGTFYRKKYKSTVYDFHLKKRKPYEKWLVRFKPSKVIVKRINEKLKQQEES